MPDGGQVADAVGVLVEVVGDMGAGGVGFPEDGADGAGDRFLVGQGIVVAFGQLYGGGVDGQPFVGVDGGAGGGDVVGVVRDELLGEAVDGMGDPGGAVFVDGGFELCIEGGSDRKEVVLREGAQVVGPVQVPGLSGGGHEAAEVVVVEDGDVAALDGFIGVGDDAVEGHVGGLYAEGGPPEGEVFDIDAGAADGGRQFDGRVGVAGDVGADAREHADDGGDELGVLWVGEAALFRDLHGHDGEAVVDVEMGRVGDFSEV